MKKLTRILVTCLMILSLSVTAFAAELPKGASELRGEFIPILLPKPPKVFMMGIIP